MIQGTVRTEKEYRQLDKDSSSSLKLFSQDKRKYYKVYIEGKKEPEEDESKASVVGRVVDTLLLEKEEFDNRFLMSSLAKAPTGNMEKFVEALYRYTRDAKEDTPFEEIARSAYKESGFKWAFDTVLAKFVGSDAEIYYKELIDVREKGLTIVTIDDVTNAERIVEELKTNEFTADIINKKSDHRFEVYAQLQVDGYSIDGLELKSMMDKCIVDHEKKTIQVGDLKCSWSVEGFYEEYYLYRRAYIQCYLYKEAAKSFFKDLVDREYKVLNPKFIVCDSINYYNPLIYASTDEDLKEAYEGFEYKGRTYPGVKEIIEELKWAKENNKWNISKKNYINRGIVSLKP